KCPWRSRQRLMDSIKDLNPQNAVEFLNAAFDKLSLGEAADKGHLLDEAISHYDTFMGHVNLFLTSPVCELYSEEVNPGDLRALLAGVRVRLDRLNKMRAIRDKPPVPGAIPLTGPGAAASVNPEAAQALADRAVQGSEAAATEGALNEAAQRLTAELRRVSLEQLSSTKDFPVTTDADTQARTGGGGRPAAAAAPGSAPTPSGPLRQQHCANCGMLGHWGSGCSSGPKDIQTANLPIVAAAGMPTATASIDPDLAKCAPPAVSAVDSASASVSVPASQGSGAVGLVPSVMAASDSGSAWSDAQSGAGGGGQAAVVLGPPPSLQRCSRCRKVLYCSVRCQRAHWTQHKPVCRN
ncbi:hypothetical protein Vretimale_12255, partial [Volvox reticuliferus]